MEDDVIDVFCKSSIDLAEYFMDFAGEGAIDAKSILVFEQYINGTAEIDSDSLLQLSGNTLIIPNTCALKLKSDEEQPLKIRFALPRCMWLYCVSSRFEFDQVVEEDQWELIADESLSRFQRYDVGDSHYKIAPFDKQKSKNQFGVCYLEDEAKSSR